MSLLTQASLILTPNAYKTSKLYSIVPSNGNGDMIVVRATTATRTNSSGLIESVAINVPRLNYDSLGSSSILLEPQRTNLALYSEQFENINWFKSNVNVINNSITSPNGIINADTLSADGVFINHRIEVPVSVIIGSKYTLSVFAKKNTNNFLQLFGSGAIWGVNAFANFDIETGVIGTIGSATTAKIENIGNGWYKCSATFEAIATTTGTIIFSIISSNFSPRGESNSLSTSFYLWGAQLEQGAYPTSYIPTTTTALTRNGDVISKTGIGVDILNPSEGTFYAEISAIANDFVQKVIEITDGTDNNRVMISCHTPSNTLRFQVWGGGDSKQQTATVADITSFNKILIKWGTNGSFGFINGIKYTLAGSGSLPTALNRITFSEWWGGSPFNGRCKGLQVYKTALTDSECISLTTL